MSEYLIKRSVDPDKSGTYLTGGGWLQYNKDLKSWTNFLRYKKDNQKEINVTYWYEPITLPEITAGIVAKKDIEILHQTTAKNEWKLLREETLAELNKMRELNESLSETILQQNAEIVELKNRLSEKK